MKTCKLFFDTYSTWIRTRVLVSLHVNFNRLYSDSTPSRSFGFPFVSIIDRADEYDDFTQHFNQVNILVLV